MHSCSHLEAAPLTPAPDGVDRVCSDCVAVGGHWVHLRRCLQCDRVACCDSSLARHASTRHRDRAPGDHLGRAG